MTPIIHEYIWSPCHGCGRAGYRTIESTSGEYSQCYSCFQLFLETGKIQAGQLLMDIRTKLLACEQAINQNSN